jgi:hypothetical protein
MKARVLYVVFLGVLIIGIMSLSNQLAQAQSDSTSSSTSVTDMTSQTPINSDSNSIPNAQYVYETGTMSLPASVKSFVIMIPDEAHHPPEDDKTISPKNPNFLPTTLEVLDGTEIAFVHGDPSHTHVEILKDKDGNVAWETIPVEHPGGSDIKTLSSSGSPPFQIRNSLIWKDRLMFQMKSLQGVSQLGDFSFQQKTLTNINPNLQIQVLM